VLHGFCTAAALVLHGSARFIFLGGEPTEPQAQKAKTAIPGVSLAQGGCAGISPGGHAPTHGEDEKAETRAGTECDASTRRVCSPKGIEIPVPSRPSVRNWNSLGCRSS